MAGEADLYHASIVDAARRRTGDGRLDACDASVTVDNPLCGDRVAIDVRLADGRMAAIAHRVRGCLLCEAAATVIAEHAPGETPARLREVAAAVRAGIAGPDDASLGPWPDLAMFAPVRGYRSRHRCVTLAFDGLTQALDAVERGD